VLLLAILKGTGGFWAAWLETKIVEYVEIDLACSLDLFKYCI
jgi:hypothetical protein